MRINKHGSLRKILHRMAFVCLFFAAPAHAGTTLPEYYGVYVRAGKLIELKPVPVTTRFGLIVGGSDRGMAVDGFEGDPRVTLETARPEIIVYLRGISLDSIHLVKLDYTSKLQAYQFNINGTNQRFFRSIYNKGYRDTISVELWQPSREIALRVAPINARQEMYRLVPSEALSAGRYAVYFGKSLHGPKSVFTASVGRQTSAYYFYIAPLSSPL